MKVFGIILIVLGTLALLYKGITYTRQEKIVDLGPVEATTEKKSNIPLSPIVGGIVLASGIVLVLASNKQHHHHHA